MTAVQPPGRSKTKVAWRTVEPASAGTAAGGKLKALPGFVWVAGA